MKGLLILLLFGVAAWYGWKHYPSLLERRPTHLAVIENQSGAELRRVRFKVDGQTFVKEVIPDKATAEFPFRVNNDSSFGMEWGWSDRTNESEWTGGMVARGPMVQRHVFTVSNDGGVMYRTEPK
jgi:hypothetical protein